MKKFLSYYNVYKMNAYRNFEISQEKLLQYYTNDIIPFGRNHGLIISEPNKSSVKIEIRNLEPKIEIEISTLFHNNNNPNYTKVRTILYINNFRLNNDLLDDYNYIGGEMHHDNILDALHHVLDVKRNLEVRPNIIEEMVEEVESERAFLQDEEIQEQENERLRIQEQERIRRQVQERERLRRQEEERIRRQQSELQFDQMMESARLGLEQQDREAQQAKNYAKKLEKHAERIMRIAENVRKRGRRGLSYKKKAYKFNRPLQLYNKNEIPKEFICPISRKIMQDPVITIDGHTYERVEIEQWLQNHDISPLGGIRLENKILIPNIALRK